MNEHDYKIMLIRGYKEHKDYLSNYYYREFQKALDNHIDAVEFFFRSKVAVKSLKDHNELLKFSRRLELLSIKQKAINGSLNINDFPMVDEDIPEVISVEYYKYYCNSLVENCNSQLKNLDKTKPSLPLTILGYKYPDGIHPESINIDDLTIIENALDEVVNIYESKQSIANQLSDDVSDVTKILSTFNSPYIDKLGLICKILINDNVIAKIKVDDFKYHFTNQVFDDNKPKIKYLKLTGEKPNKKGLYNLIHILINKEKLQKVDFLLTEKCFSDSKGNKIQITYQDKQNSKKKYNSIYRICKGDPCKFEKGVLVFL